jgi:hypothetical protein
VNLLSAITAAFRAEPPRDREVIAGLRDQIIEIGTHVRFLEADKPVPQPRDEAGRFVSRRDIIRKQLEAYRSATTPEQRRIETEAAFVALRAANSRSMENGRGRG